MHHLKIVWVYARYSLVFLYLRRVLRTFQIPVHFQIVLYPPPFPHSVMLIGHERHLAEDLLSRGTK